MVRDASGPDASRSLKDVHRVLLAACNERALDVIADCESEGIPTVAVYSTDDADAPCVKLATESVCIGDRRDGGCYTDPYTILSAAEQRRANGIHLCDGPLTGDDGFVRLAVGSGFIVLENRKEGE